MRRGEAVSELLRGCIFHVPGDPFGSDEALETIEDGALRIDHGRIAEIGAYADLRRRFPDVPVTGRPDDLLLPGFVDGHVHYPQVPVMGAMGLRLLTWLQTRTLPEEVRFADGSLARQRAKEFLDLLARNGTTSALVFGAHFAQAMQAFFAEAEASGLRVAAGLVVSDRNLRSELHTTPEQAVADARALVERWHGRGRLRYAVTPRFSLSCSDAMLAACAEVFQARPDLLFTSHLNETRDEIATVGQLFPDAGDYLATYERHGLVGPRSVFAHDVHPTDAEVARLGAVGASVCHCPSSNMFIGSGLFPLRRHLLHAVRVCLGTDVGGGTGFSLLKEGLMAYQGQMLLEDGVPLTPARLLWLATRSGAEALGLGDEVGDFRAAKAADVVSLRAPEGSTLQAVWRHASGPEAALAAAFTLAREESVRAVWVEGERVFTAIQPG